MLDIYVHIFCRHAYITWIKCILWMKTETSFKFFCCLLCSSVSPCVYPCLISNSSKKWDEKMQWIFLFLFISYVFFRGKMEQKMQHYKTKLKIKVYFKIECKLFYVFSSTKLYSKLCISHHTPTAINKKMKRMSEFSLSAWFLQSFVEL